MEYNCAFRVYFPRGLLLGASSWCRHACQNGINFNHGDVVLHSTESFFVIQKRTLWYRIALRNTESYYVVQQSSLQCTEGACHRQGLPPLGLTTAGAYHRSGLSPARLTTARAYHRLGLPPAGLPTARDCHWLSVVQNRTAWYRIALRSTESYSVVP